MAARKRKTGKSFTSKSARTGSNVKVPRGQEFAGYFYTGPSADFGHVKPKKKKH